MARLLFSMETINFQYDDTGKRMEAIFSELVEFVKRKYQETGKCDKTIKILERTQFSKELSEFCMNRFGLRIMFDFSNTSGGPFVEPMAINASHVFIDDFWRGEAIDDWEYKITKELIDRKGTIDLKEAKVTGIFSYRQHRLAMNIVDLVINFNATVPQLVAVCLHEIGHIFTWYEYSDRLTSTNQILANLATEIRTENRPEKREYWFRELSDKTNKPLQEFEDVVHEKNRTILGFKLAQIYLEHVCSQMPNEAYDRTASEQIADNFAARFGYGRYIVEFLQIMHEANGSPETSRIMRIFVFLQEVLFLVLIAASIFILITGLVALIVTNFIGAVAMIFYLFAMCMMVVGAGDSYRDMTYDDLKIRYKRVRQQLIQQLKDTQLSDGTVHTLIEQIKQIDKVDKRATEYGGLLNTISNILFKSNRDAHYEIRIQQLIEDLAHNDLYMKSAQLRLTASSTQTS
ncbi:MAG: hypothetical protein ACR2HF_02660 [Methylococcaceae bacterium]